MINYISYVLEKEHSLKKRIVKTRINKIGGVFKTWLQKDQEKI